MFDKPQNLKLKLKNIPINVEMISVLQKADKEYSKDVGETPLIDSCIAGETVISIDLSLPYIGNFYYMFNYLNRAQIREYEALRLLEWLERVCMEYLSKYDIPENVLRIELESLKWSARNLNHDNQENPFKVTHKYKVIATETAHFILHKIRGGYVYIDERMFLEIWKNIKSLNKLYIF